MVQTNAAIFLLLTEFGIAVTVARIAGVVDAEYVLRPNQNPSLGRFFVILGFVMLLESVSYESKDSPGRP